MIILNQYENNTVYMTLSENLDDSIFGTTSNVDVCNLMLDYVIDFYDKNTKMSRKIIVTDLSIRPNRYNEFEIDLGGFQTPLPTIGTYTYEAYLYDGIGATGSCLEKGMCKVEGEEFPEEYIRENDNDFIYIRNNT